MIDERCERRTFVRNPESLLMKEFGKGEEKITSLKIKRHPMNYIEGDRFWNLDEDRIYLEKNDLLKKEIRLKDFADIEISGNDCSIISYNRSDRRPIVHWLPESMARKAVLTIPDGEKLVIQEGMIENFELIKGEIVQLERVGYAIIESDEDADIIQLLWLHG